MRWNWTPERIAQVKEHVEAGRSRAEIAKIMGLSPHSVRHAIHRYELKERVVSFWTPDKDDQVRKLYASGVSIRAIAAIMGITDGMVAGKVHRLGLTGKREHVPSPRRKKARTAQVVTLFRDPTPVPVEHAVGPVKIVDLCPHHCRWPLAMHEGERTFCGRQRAADGTSYCAEHLEASMAPPDKRRLKGSAYVRSLRRYAA